MTLKGHQSNPHTGISPPTLLLSSCSWLLNYYSLCAGGAAVSCNCGLRVALGCFYLGPLGSS